MAATQELHDKIDRLTPQDWLALLQFLKSAVDQGKEEFNDMLEATQRLVMERGYATTTFKENP